MIRKPVYKAVARWYDAVSLERPIYRPGRVRAIESMALSVGDRVLDVGCGTGLNFSLVQEAIGSKGSITGVDRSTSMLAQARNRASKRGWRNVDLMNADATSLRADDFARDGQLFDAALATYSLSLMEQWRSAWDLMKRLVRPGGRIAVVELGYPTGRALLARPLARLACQLGGSEPERVPWRAVERDLIDLQSVDLWGGHVLVRVGTRPAS